jgi:hypothetical protein
MSTHYSAAPLLIEAQLRFRAFKFPENAGVIDSLMPFLIHMGERSALIGDGQQMHPAVATGISYISGGVLRDGEAGLRRGPCKRSLS